MIGQILDLWVLYVCPGRDGTRLHERFVSALVLDSRFVPSERYILQNFLVFKAFAIRNAKQMYSRSDGGRSRFKHGLI